MVANALAAAAVGVRLGVPPDESAAALSASRRSRRGGWRRSTPTACRAERRVQREPRRRWRPRCGPRMVDGRRRPGDRRARADGRARADRAPRSTSASASSSPAWGSRVLITVGPRRRRSPSRPCARAWSRRTWPATTTPTRRSRTSGRTRAPGDVVLVKASRVGSGLRAARRRRARDLDPRRRRGRPARHAPRHAVRDPRLPDPGIGQRIREDGPHTHMDKMGTPTMGGIVILAGLVVGYLVARLTSRRFTVTGLALVLAAVGLGIVGFLDDYMKIRPQTVARAHEGAKFVGQAVVSIGFAVLSRGPAPRRASDPPVVRPAHRARPRAPVLRVGVRRADRIVERREPDRRPRRARDRVVDARLERVRVHLVLAGPPHVRLAERDDRLLRGERRRPPRHGDRRGGDVGAATGFLWWNAAPARIFMGDTGSLALGGLLRRARRRDEHRAAAGDHGRVVRAGDDLGDHPGRSRSAASTAGCSGCRRSTTTSSCVGWHEFTVIVRFWIVAGLWSAFGLGLFYADFLARGGLGMTAFSRERAVVVGAGVAGSAAARVLVAEEGARPRHGRRAARAAGGDLEAAGARTASSVHAGGHDPSTSTARHSWSRAPACRPRTDVLGWATTAACRCGGRSSSARGSRGCRTSR